MQSLSNSIRGGTIALTLLLAACGQGPRIQTGSGTPPARPSSQPSAPPIARGPVPDTPVKIGKPYQVAGLWYTPTDEAGYDEVGYASWYGDAFHGGATANGERFDMDTVSAAHKTLPLPSYVEVTALDTGRTILVRVNDRGPFVTNRIIDLSRRSAEMLGIARKGVARVRVRRVEPPATDRLELRSGRAAAARPDADGTQLAALDARFQRWIAAQTPPPAPVTAAVKAEAPPPMPGFDAARQSLAASAIGGWFVQIGAYGDRARADSLAAALGANIESAGNMHRVRVGPYFDEGVALATLARLQRDGYQDARLIRPTAAN